MLQDTKVDKNSTDWSLLGGSKLTMSLVNVSLNFKLKYYKYTVIFCWKNVRIFCNAKDSHIFPTKNNSVFDNLVGIYLTS